MVICNLASELPAHPMNYTFRPRDVIPLWPDVLWKIERGVVRTLTWTTEDTLMTLGYWAPGDILGTSLFRLPKPYQVECLMPTQISRQPSYLGQDVSDAVLLHVQQAQELLSIVRCDRAHVRLLNFLVWLAKKFGCRIEEGLLINLRLTHQHIAEAIGITRVTVTRLLQQFEQEGIVCRYRRRTIVLRQM